MKPILQQGSPRNQGGQDKEEEWPGMEMASQGLFTSATDKLWGHRLWKNTHYLGPLG